VQASEEVLNRAFELPEDMRQTRRRSPRRWRPPGDKRVSLVMAKQQIADELPGEPASALTERAVSLIDRAVESVSDWLNRIGLSETMGAVRCRV
jgi:hypothetical protein